MDTFGNRSEAIVTEEVVTAPKLPGILPTYLVNETFTTEPTDAATHAIPVASPWGSCKTPPVMEYKDGMANFVYKGDSNCEMLMPLMTGTGATTTPTGPLMVEWEWQGVAGTGQECQAYFRNAAGKNVFVARAYAAKYDFRFINSSNGSARPGAALRLQGQKICQKCVSYFIIQEPRHM